jgi:hypothetical protein
MNPYRRTTIIKKENFKYLVNELAATRETERALYDNTDNRILSW